MDESGAPMLPAAGAGPVDVTVSAREAIEAVTGLPTKSISTCKICLHPRRFEIEWAYINRDDSDSEIADVFGVHVLTLVAHCKHQGLFEWRIKRSGLESALSRIISSGLLNSSRAKPSDVVRAVEVMAKMQGIIKESSKSSAADLLQELNNFGKSAAFAAVAADAEVADYTVAGGGADAGAPGSTVAGESGKVAGGGADPY